jgi:hypothetical protein
METAEIRDKAPTATRMRESKPRVAPRAAFTPRSTKY